jgi:predicted acetyltransferase
MYINFLPLTDSHFLLLLKWLETPHVKKWWDPTINWTLELIQEKYISYVKGYKLEKGIAKPLQAFIIYIDNEPMGYIQIYNAYDFARISPLTGLPASLGAFDILIGEEKYLRKGIGSKVITQFLQVHGKAYIHIFVDPNKNNIAAIKAYEKASFKKHPEQPATEELWMLRKQSDRPEPLCTIQKLLQERYPQAQAVFWGGSVSQNRGTAGSDLDLVIICKSLPQAYREAFIYDEWPIDVFLHDRETLHYFLEESRSGSGISGTLSMILKGQEVTQPTIFSEHIKILAKEIFQRGPLVWDKKILDKERFLITDILSDIQYAASPEEQMASAAWLLEALGQFYFRAQNKWCASGKSIIRYLKNADPGLALNFTNAFKVLFKTGSCLALEALVEEILIPYGGLLWNGFRSDADQECRIKTDSVLPNIKILPVTPVEYPIIQNMARFYVYDMSRHMGWAFPENGTLDCIDFKHYVEKPENKAFLIRVNNELAGFVLLDKKQLSDRIDWNMGQFFLAAKFQGKGISQAVAREVFKTHPGKWSVAAMPENIKAVKFWRKLIGELSRGHYTEIFKTANELRSADNPDASAMMILNFDTNRISK